MRYCDKSGFELTYIFIKLIVIKNNLCYNIIYKKEHGFKVKISKIKGENYL